MREIVHLQAGQCGNQIGSKVIHNKEPVFSTNVHSFRWFMMIKYYFALLLSQNQRFKSPMSIFVNHFVNKAKGFFITAQ